MRIVILLLILALCQPALAQDWPSVEVKIACPSFIRAILYDEALAYYGCGEREKDEEMTRPAQIVQGDSIRMDLLNFYLQNLKAAALRPKANRTKGYDSYLYADERELDIDVLNQKIWEQLSGRWAQETPQEITETLNFLSALPPYAKILELESKLFLELLRMADQNDEKEAIFDQALKIAGIMPVIRDQDGSFRNWYRFDENGNNSGGFRDSILSDLLSIAEAASRNGIPAGRLLEMLEAKGLMIKGKEFIK